ncbi:hypothetical protein PAPYR_4310 [Paratrimastix pyriformis]|uniref:EF-hand domain-containing protein n=1 Tax=Paratrimastix pyriformis TaxID=342808 RepID=A0ABQ8UK39_9EUKA|nr:hypothetical protein PAPYR_4310 [Paratrimastix pyriformis]
MEAPQASKAPVMHQQPSMRRRKSEYSQHNFTEDEILEMREAFTLFDGDDSGTIDAHEFAKVIGIMGKKASTEEAERMFRSVDTDGNGTIDFSEFLELMRNNWIEAEDSPEEIVEAFKAFDVDGVGHITAAKFREFFHKLDLDLSPQEIDELIAQIDVDHDGSIDYSEFARMLLDPTMGGVRSSTTSGIAATRTGSPPGGRRSPTPGARPASKL